MPSALQKKHLCPQDLLHIVQLKVTDHHAKIKKDQQKINTIIATNSHIYKPFEQAEKLNPK